MKSENRHYTKVWKKKRKDKHADRCGNAKCMICSSKKILDIPTRQLLRENSKLKDE